MGNVLDFVDEYGRQHISRGTNSVVKGEPWLPSREEYNGLHSLVAKDFQIMKAFGYNAQRLGSMWPGVEPTKDVYDEDYLQGLYDISVEAGTYGIYTLMDMH